MAKKRFNELLPEERWEILQKNPNQILLEGKGMPLSVIINWYLEKIEDGFQLTIDDLASVLDCSYDFVLKHIAPQLTHIRITEVIRAELLKTELKGEWYPLVLKRILFQKKAWEQCLLESATYEQRYRRFNLKEPGKIQDWVRENDLDFSVSKEVLDQAFEKLIMKWGLIDKPHTLEHIPLKKEQIQERWFSTKSLLKMYGMKYPVQVHRMLARRGVNPIQIGNFVRFSQEEIEMENLLFYPNGFFVQLEEILVTRLTASWIRKANQILENIANS